MGERRPGNRLADERTLLGKTRRVVQGCHCPERECAAFLGTLWRKRWTRNVEVGRTGEHFWSFVCSRRGGHLQRDLLFNHDKNNK